MLRPMRPDLRSGKVKRKEIFNCTLENPSVRGRRQQLSIHRKRELMGEQPIMLSGWDQVSEAD
jgi:hypothetical protein